MGDSENWGFDDSELRRVRREIDERIKENSFAIRFFKGLQNALERQTVEKNEELIRSKGDGQENPNQIAIPTSQWNRIVDLEFGESRKCRVTWLQSGHIEVLMTDSQDSLVGVNGQLIAFELVTVGQRAIAQKLDVESPESWSGFDENAVAGMITEGLVRGYFY
ncbi:MAG TPA: hypothetical protein VG844_07930 [Terracidiphilus sp.]|nr:hypothetical protein [Terracidiphilus sp.]